MGKIQITSPGIKKALKKYQIQQAISEYIWNGFDADATEVRLNIDSDDIGHINSFVITDNGYGIPVKKLSGKFDPFFESEKEIDPNVERTTSQVHGKNGVGRLTFFTLANQANWETVYSENGQNLKYKIAVKSESLNSYSSTPVANTMDPTGTTVEFIGINSFTFGQFESGVKEYLMQEFAWFLELNASKGYAIYINDEKLDYTPIIGEKESFVHVEGNYEFEIRYVRWQRNTNREYSRYYFINSLGVEQHKETTTLNLKSDHFFHSVFIKSAFFDEYKPFHDSSANSDSQLGLLGDATGKEIFKALRSAVDHFLRTKRKPFLKEYSERLIEEYERGGVFPKFNGNGWEQYRRNELEDVIRELYQVEPKIFSKLNVEQRKTFVYLYCPTRSGTNWQTINLHFRLAL